MKTREELKTCRCQVYFLLVDWSLWNCCKAVAQGIPGPHDQQLSITTQQKWRRWNISARHAGIPQWVENGPGIFMNFQARYFSPTASATTFERTCIINISSCSRTGHLVWNCCVVFDVASQQNRPLKKMVKYCNHAKGHSRYNSKHWQYSVQHTNMSCCNIYIYIVRAKICSDRRDHKNLKMPPSQLFLFLLFLLWSRSAVLLRQRRYRLLGLPGHGRHPVARPSPQCCSAASSKVPRERAPNEIQEANQQQQQQREHVSCRVFKTTRTCWVAQLSILMDVSLGSKKKVTSLIIDPHWQTYMFTHFFGICRNASRDTNFQLHHPFRVPPFGLINPVSAQQLNLDFGTEVFAPELVALAPVQNDGMQVATIVTGEKLKCRVVRCF